MANFNWLDQWRDVGRKVGHSPFSLDKKQGFGLPNSQIVPIHFIDTVPGDHFQINLNGLMRTKTLNTAAFFGGKMFVNVFFVPYSQLWHPFNQFISQKVDKHSTRFRGSAYAPVVDLYKVAKFIVLYKDVTDEFGFRLVDSIVKLFQFAKIKNFYPLLMMLRTPALASDVDSWIDDNCTVGSDKVHIKVNILRLLAYQHIFYDFYRNKIYDDHPYYVDISTTPLDYVDTFNVDDLSCTSVSDNEIPISLGLRDRTDNYFNEPEDARIANIFKLHYHQYRKDVFTSLMPSTQFGAVSGIGFDLEHQHSVNGDNSTLITEFDSGRWKTVNDSSLGTDSIVKTSQPAGSLWQDGDVQINIKHDHAYYVNNIAAHLGTGNSLTDAYMNVLDWRRAELLQQWKQNALRAGNMVDDNFEAHYGVKPYYEDDNNVRFLGGFEARLDINAVVANASTGEAVNGNVGDIAGIGIGSFNGRPIDVQIKDFGVIVACASFVSDAYYNADGTDKSNTKIEPFDFFNKEFENVGFDSIPLSVQNSNLGSYSQLNMGYTPPFTEYKTDIDEVYGSFMDTISMYDGSTAALLFRGDMRDWVATRRDFEKSNFVSFVSQYGLFKTRFYQSPALTNNIFESAYDGTIVTDPFSFNLSWDIKAIRPMTVLGIPVFA